MKVCAVDSCGAGLGSRLVAGLRAQMPEGHDIVGLGLNQASAQAMERAGAMSIATQPRVIHQRVSTAGLIVGSLSLLMPGAMLGEVTPELVQALFDSPARSSSFHLTVTTSKSSDPRDEPSPSSSRPSGESRA